jgi:monoamine oxidase
MRALGVTRRQFLIGLGAVGGAGAVVGALQVIDRGGDTERRPFRPPRAGDFTLQGRANETSVAVLGAGVAGLACAYELEKAGYRVTVLEARDRIGGRNLTVRSGTEITDSRGTTQRATFAEGRWYNAGPARIAGHHTTLDYCRELGVAIEPFVNVNVDAYQADGPLVRRKRTLAADLDGYVAELLAKAVAEHALDEELSADERDALFVYLREVAGLAPLERGYYREPPGAGEASGRIDDPDRLATLLAFDPGARRFFERDWHLNTPMFHPVGGMDALPRALADHLVGDVRTGADVVALGDGDGVTVELADGSTVEADHGICTLPPGLAAALDAPWGEDVDAALETPEPFTTGKLGLEYRRRFWELDARIFGGISSTDREPREIWYPSTDYLAEGGVIVGAYPFGTYADRFSHLTHEARTEVALVAGEAIHGPAYRDDLVSSFSVDWRTQSFSDGAWADWSAYGYEYGLLLEPAGRWWFAGDWMSHAVGWQHGALESARLTVTGLHERVLAEG